MYPELFKIGPLTIYSFGLMLGLAFLTANMLLVAELKRRKLDPALGTTITMLALIGGITGAKLFHVLENWKVFLNEPFGTVFSSGGLTWYGGLLVVIALIFIYVRKKRRSMLEVADMTSPGLALAYGIGRIGCHLAGDGDYGIPTDVPWAVSYEHGTVPTAFTLDQFGDRIPTEWVHPTPVYELLLAVLVFSFLFRRRTKVLPLGNQFGYFLILHSLSRFLIEFWRINPRMFLGLSEAQLISIALIGWGFFLIFRKTSIARQGS
jgi:phosphatidylglycerol---prolipoprotein diacylglyceryl transferase